MADGAPAPEEVLTIVEAAALCRVSADVMYRLAAEGAVPAKKVGGQWRLRRSVLLKWLDESGESSTSSRAGTSGGPRSPRSEGAPSTSPSKASPKTTPTASRRRSSAPAPSIQKQLLQLVRRT
ncbi:MAG: DNA-binding protein [Myxococcaceae bacterium]|nr:MAG: DNA-binding protein [Myxococcaceae bacterium]